MSLDQKIIEQYGQRDQKDILYSGLYAQRSLAERATKIRGLMDRYKMRDDTILEIGAGHGDNVPLLLDCGFNLHDIYLNEMLAPRVENIRQRYPQVTLFAGNALDLNFNKTFNWVFQSTVFTSVFSNTDRQLLAGRMWDLLAPGGFVLWYDFVYNNPSNPHVKKVSIAETRSLFPLAVKSDVQRVTLAPPIGRRVGKMYDLFNVPFLRSHILAVFQKPQ